MPKPKHLFHWKLAAFIVTLGCFLVANVLRDFESNSPDALEGYLLAVVAGVSLCVRLIPPTAGQRGRILDLCAFALIAVSSASAAAALLDLASLWWPYQVLMGVLGLVAVGCLILGTLARGMTEALKS